MVNITARLVFFLHPCLHYPFFSYDADLSKPPMIFCHPPQSPGGRFLHRGPFYQLIKKMIEVNGRLYPTLPHVWPSAESLRVKNITVKLCCLRASGMQFYKTSTSCFSLIIRKKNISGSSYAVNHHISVVTILLALNLVLLELSYASPSKSITFVGIVHLLDKHHG